MFLLIALAAFTLTALAIFYALCAGLGAIWARILLALLDPED